jgi:hypothetical protein
VIVIGMLIVIVNGFDFDLSLIWARLGLKYTG